jgi:hypothetical protein
MNTSLTSPWRPRTPEPKNGQLVVAVIKSSFKGLIYIFGRFEKPANDAWRICGTVENSSGILHPPFFLYKDVELWMSIPEVEED